MTRVNVDAGLNGINLQLEYGSIVDAATNGGVTSSTTAMKFSLLEAWLQTTSKAFYDSSNTFSASGNGVAAVSLSNIDLNMATNQTKKLSNLTGAARNLSYGSTTPIAVTLTLNGVGFAGDMTGTFTVQAPARPYTAPSTPTVYIDGTHVQATGHQRDPAKDKFWNTVQVALETNDVWATWLSNGGSAQYNSWAYNADQEDSRYRGRVRALNANATGEYGYSNYFYTAPKAPTGFTAARTSPGSTSVNLAWTNNARYNGFTRIWKGVDGAAPTHQFTTSGSVSSYTDTLPLGSTAVYYIATATPFGWNQPVSAPSSSVTVGKGYSTPTAPTAVTLTFNPPASADVGINGNVNNTGTSTYWQFVDHELQKDAEAYGATSSATGSTTTLVKSGLLANSRYRARARSRNVVGSSAWVESGFIYTKPAAPSGVSHTRVGGTNKVTLFATDAAAWGSGVQVERSLDGGTTYAQIAVITSGSHQDSLQDEKPAIYRFSTVTPSGLRSDYVTEVVDGVFATDKTKIPGVARIYAGAERVRQVMYGSTRFWTDGE